MKKLKKIVSRTGVILFLGLVNSGLVHAQNVNIPDPAFLASLLGNVAINTNGDGYIQVSEANAFSGAINVSGLGISDLIGIEEFHAIDSLDCSSNNLGNLLLTANPALVDLNCSNNQLFNLDIYSCSSLLNFRCMTNQLDYIDVSGNLLLQDLRVDFNYLNYISVYNNTALTFFSCEGNSMSSMNLSNNLSLMYLQCDDNDLSALDVTANTALIDLRCANNQLLELDLSLNANLEVLICTSNNLTLLNIQNGANAGLTLFFANYNPLLSCVQVDDASYMQINFASSIDGTTSYNTICGPCNVNIPDNTFKNILLADVTVNTNGNGEIECSEAAAYTGYLMLAAGSINDLTGIEAFVNLTGLNCSANFLTFLNITSNTALTDLRCVNNQLTYLNISNCPNLTTLYCWNNQLTGLNFVDNPNIDTIDCSFNQIGSLDLTANNALQYIDCSYNQISNLDLSNNNLLTMIGCGNNLMTSLNIQNGNNSNLSNFNATNNAIGLCVQVDDVVAMTTNWNNAIDVDADYSANCAVCNINIPDANFKAALLSNYFINTNTNTEIECSEAAAYTGTIFVGNLGITDLTGIEAFPGITQLNCSMNLLTTLDLSTNYSLYFVEAHGNQLTSITLPQGSTLSEVLVADNQLTSIDVGSNSYLTYLDCNSNNIINLNVLSNTYLSYLFCEGNELTNLDCSNNYNLIQLGCSYNQLTFLNIQNGNNSNLTSFDALFNPDLSCVQVDSVPFMMSNWPGAIDNTAIYNVSCACIVSIPDANFKAALVSNTAINTNGNSEIECSEASMYADTIYVANMGIVDLTGIEAFTSITGLVCNLNSISTLDLSNNPDLNFLHAYDNQLTSLNVSNNPALVNLWCSYNALSSLDVSNNLLLEGLACFDNNLNQLDVSNNILLNDLRCSINNLSTLDVTNNTLLELLYCDDNDLNSIDVTNNSLMHTFICFKNNFNSLDVTQNPLLKDFRCSLNNLTTVDLSNNAQLELLYCGNNIINSLDLSANLLLEILDCGPNQLTSIDLSNNTFLSTFDGGSNNIAQLDLSNNPALTIIYANSNALTSLKINNGNNANLTNFSALNNPDLTCIQVDDVSFMNSNWAAAKDAIANYNTICPLTCPNIPISFSSGNTNLISLPMNAVFANTTPALSNYSFVWYFGDGTMAVNNNASINHTYYYNGIYTVSLVAYNNITGCSDTLVNSNYITCNTSGALTCNHTVSLNLSGVINACTGSIVPLSSSTNTNTPAYQWNRNGVMIGGASQESYYADVNGNYTLTVFDIQGCPITSSPVQINYSLQSSIAPIITSTGLVGNCGNINVTLSATGSFTNYFWSNGQNGSSINVTQGGSYTVTGQSPACDAVSLPFDIAGSVAPVPPICMVTVDETDNKNVVIWEKPVSAAIDSFLVLREDISNAGIYTILSTQSYVDLSEFKDVSSDANARAYRYKLAVKDTCAGITIPSTQQRSMHLDVAQGNSVLSRQLTWNVYQGQPQAFTHYLIYRETVPGNLNLALIDSVPGTQTWYYDNTLTSIADTARAYKIGYRVTTPCVSTRAQNDICSSNVTANEKPTMGGPDGMNQLSIDAFDFTIFPNPNNGKFIIQTHAFKSYQLKVFNLIGEELYQQPINNQQFIFDLSNLSNGVYIVSLEDESNIQSKRLVLTK